jgi:hypothetical protein
MKAGPVYLMVSGLIFVQLAIGIFVKSGHIGSSYRYLLRSEASNAVIAGDQARRDEVERAIDDLNLHTSALVDSQVSCAATLGGVGLLQGVAGVVFAMRSRKKKTAEPGATDNPDDAQ